MKLCTSRSSWSYLIVATLILGLVTHQIVAKAESPDVAQEESYTFRSIASLYLSLNFKEQELEVSENVDADASKEKEDVDPHAEEIVFLFGVAGGKLTKEEIRHIIMVCRNRNIEPLLIVEMFRQESHFDSDAVGPNIPRKNRYGTITHYVNAKGIAQIMPDDTGPGLAALAKVKWDESQLSNVQYSTTLAATYLQYLYYGDGDKFAGYKDWHKVLTAYNRGQGGMRSYVRTNGTPVSKYSKSILDKVKDAGTHL